MATVLDYMNVGHVSLKQAQDDVNKADPAAAASAALEGVFKSYPSVQAMINEAMELLPKAFDAAHRAIDIVDPKDLDQAVAVAKAPAGAKGTGLLANVTPFDLPKLRDAIASLHKLCDISKLVDAVQGVATDEKLITDMKARYQAGPEKFDVDIVRNALRQVDLEKDGLVSQLGVVHVALEKAKQTVHDETKQAINSLTTELGGMAVVLKDEVRRLIAALDSLIYRVFG